MDTSTNIDIGGGKWRGPVAKKRNGEQRIRWKSKRGKGEVTSKGLTQ